MNLPFRNPRCIYILLLSLFSSCSLLPPEEAYFGYLKIPAVSLNSSKVSGFPSHNIRDVWVYGDEQALGVYNLPSQIPVLSTGVPTTFRVRGGIKQNGNNATSIEYPFYNDVVFSQKIAEDETHTKSMIFSYKDEAIFDLVEDFEGGNLFMSDVDGDANTTLGRIAGVSPYGNYCGSIHLTKVNDAIEVSHFTSFPNSKNKKGAVYLEFDYKCDEKIFVGSILEKSGVLIKEYKVLVTESSSWKKFYLDLTNEISKSDVISYKVVFSAALVSGNSEANIYLDNIKLIHF